MKRLSLCLALLCALLACGEEDSSTRDTLTLTITSDLRAPNEIDRVTVSVAGQDAQEDPEADLREQPLPRTLTLVHEAGPRGPFSIEVTGWLGITRVVQRTVRASFADSGDSALTIQLERACRSVACGGGQTCEGGRCEPVDEEPTLDAGVDASDAGQDGRTADVLVDAVVDAAGGESDAAEESDADAGHDADYDAGNAGAPPTCSVTLPVGGDTYQAGVGFALRGTCTDPESGALTAINWTSSRDGLLGSGASLDGTLTTLGAQRISLCADDPRDSRVTGCATIDVQVSNVAQPTVGIASILQGAASASPYGSGAALSFTGSATGAGVTVSWSDDVQGLLGTGTTVSVATPLVAKHTVTLTVVDRNGAQNSTTRSYVVIGAGESNLVSPLPSVNAELDRVGEPAVPTIASDPAARAYVPSTTGVLYRFDGNTLASNATVAVDRPPLRAVVQDVQVAADRNLTYLATADGLTVCGYVPASGVNNSCSNFRAGGVLQSQSFLSVLRMVDSRNVDSLMVGSDNGLFISESVLGSTRGTTVLRGRTIHDLVKLGGQAAIATDNGLTLMVPSQSAQTVRFSTGEGLPSNNLRALAVGSDGALWIASAGGLARFEPGSNRITAWTTARGLPSNSATGVAVHRPTQLSPARDIVWVSTTAGIARLDTQSNVITTFTAADGLPSNSALSVHVLTNGIKLFGTEAGLARFIGP